MPPFTDSSNASASTGTTSGNVMGYMILCIKSQQLTHIVNLIVQNEIQ